MNPTGSERPAWQRWIVRHLFLYLALIAGVTVIVSVIAARGQLRDAMRDFRPELGLVVIGLSFVNYVIRFTKWDRLLRDSGLVVERISSARIYFACLSMVVTPARLGELYKLVFLRRLHGIRSSKSIPPLVLERVTDALALLALCGAQPFSGPARLIGIAGVYLALVGLAELLAIPASRRPLLSLAGRMPVLKNRQDRLAEVLDGHARLLRARSFALSLGLSVASWWCECLGLKIICAGLGASLSIGDATWVYAAATLLGNLTFLPGGLGGTEIALKLLLERVGVAGSVALPATLLIRAATLWFAVFLGLAVTLIGRRRLQWDSVRREAAT